ncbi:hypothetical protein A3I46_01075 [Candidatus Kaiserbacteria bacterium RIFCSPLOWO2_02_FULL_54_13]|nr:MAG: hypothetical protein A3I46_01075 [Candidatus Kaiserbacteria bacterium RIFCSPLOWO2_02_FULL_54_13]OGG90191.1 MAG: hypothetical protein A3G12_02310 [Candidatus Kaiserbacteria bacterium RIFCSPLOWO2_12_FULL_54_10]
MLVPNDPREKPLYRSDDQKQDMHTIMPDTAHKMACLIAQERGKIDVCENELYTFYVLVEARTVTRSEPHAPPRFVMNEHEKAGEQCECDTNKNKAGHDD